MAMSASRTKFNEQLDGYYDYYELPQKSDGTFDEKLANYKLEISRPKVTVNGLVEYTFKYSVHPAEYKKIADTNTFNELIFEVGFICSNLALDKSNITDTTKRTKPVDNIYIKSIPEDYEIVSEKDSLETYMSVVGGINDLVNNYVSANPISPILPFINTIISLRNKKAVGKAAYVKFGSEKLTIGIYNRVDENTKTILGNHETSIMLCCSSDLKTLMPEKVTLKIDDNNKTKHEFLLIDNYDAAKTIIARFGDNTHELTEIKDIKPVATTLKKGSIIFICEAGSYVSDNKMDGSIPLPDKHGFLIGNMIEKITLEEDDKWSGKKLYPKSTGSYVTLIALPLESLSPTKYGDPTYVLHQVN